MFFVKPSARYLNSKIFNFDVTDRIYSLFYSDDVNNHNTYTKVPSALFQEESKEQLCMKLMILYCHIVDCRGNQTATWFSQGTHFTNLQLT